MEKSFKTIPVLSDTKVTISIPFEPSELWGKRETYHVAGTIHGIRFRGALVETTDGYVLSLGAAWKRDCGVDFQEEIEVTIAPEGHLSSNLATDIAATLLEDAEATDFFDSMPSFYRNNYIRWITEAKRPETRSARIAEMMRLLKAKQRSK